MDSLSQMALGAAVAVATLGRRTAVWKAAAWGAVAGTLPDLDVLIDQGDAIRNMVLHRAESHALLWLALASLPLGAAVARLQGEWAQWRRWWLAMALALLTHPLLDAMTVYGTQLLLPFTNHPYGVGSVFIIDPLYTLPLLLGLGWALRRRGQGGSLRANAAGLLLSTAYLGWGVLAQQQVAQVAQASLQAQGIQASNLLVTPTAFNTVLWRVLAVDAGHFYEGYYSLLDAEPRLQLDRFDRGAALAPLLQDQDGVRRLMAFSHGFYKLHRQGDRLLISDLRMGQEPAYVFTFAVASQAPGHAGATPLVQPEQLSARIDLARGLAWLWPRLLGQPLPPPR